MSEQPSLYVGLISGTSVDCIDAALVDFADDEITLVEKLGVPIPADTQRAVRALMLPGDNEIDRMGVIDQRVGHLFADAANSLLKQAGIKPSHVAAIGSHGQTIRHRPPGELEAAFTLQIGDPNVIAELTGITTVADLRRRDMAAGGQGAPLVPAFHRAVFASPRSRRIIVNIGGIGNITDIPLNEPVSGFDTGPGNCLMDEWVQHHLQQDFDRDGQWAGRGHVHIDLLAQLLQHPYFAKPIPKSTGREEFHLRWLHEVLQQFPNLAPEDVQATLLELTATSISQHIRQLPITDSLEVYVCGGGAHNRGLMRRLEQLLAPTSVDSTNALGIAPDWVEAIAFAWLAKQTINHRAGNVASVTGASREVILGGIYLAS